VTQGERVREVRKNLGLTLDKFGERIGIKKSALSSIENGRSNLTDANIKAICREFNVDYIWLTTGEGEMLPDFIRECILNPNIIKVAHNAVFERLCLSKHLGVKLAASSWVCTMVWSSMLGLPASLDKVAKALDLSEQKDTKGKLLINYFCKPCTPTKTNGGRRRNTPQDAPEKWKQFIEYNRQDVKAEVAIFDRLKKFPISQKEHELWCLDQRINDTGIRIDTNLVNHILDFLLTKR